MENQTTSNEKDHSQDRSKHSLAEQGSPFVEIDLAAEKKLVKKLDFYIIPIVMLLYLFSFLDRYGQGRNLTDRV